MNEITHIIYVSFYHLFHLFFKYFIILRHCVILYFTVIKQSLNLKKFSFIGEILFIKYTFGKYLSFD